MGGDFDPFNAPFSSLPRGAAPVTGGPVLMGLTQIDFVRISFTSTFCHPLCCCFMYARVFRPMVAQEDLGPGRPCGGFLLPSPSMPDSCAFLFSFFLDPFAQLILGHPPASPVTDPRAFEPVFC